MRRNRLLPILMATLLAVTLAAEVSLAAGRPHARRGTAYGYHRGPSGFEFVLEGAMAMPAGDQKDDLDFLGQGKDAGTGYELGLRFRQYVAPGLAVAPAFHYVEFGKTSGVGDFAEEDNLGFEVKTSLMRYGLDFQFFLGEPRAQRVQPYVTGGIALIHNRYRDELQYYGPYEASVNAPGVSLGAGLRAASFELSGVYTFNRFSTGEFASAPGDLDYNWDYLSVRFGLAFGTR
ncbi:hypothetical protein KJ682_11265 [bacterium]|nr:hypothetical protein [bacterium]